MILKRLLDVALSITMIIILSPLLLIIGFLIRVTSKGPVIFKQERVGYYGKIFTIFKFRTLKHDLDKTVNRVTKGDSRITVIGSFLRKTHLDELPQLWNVIRGEMSIVGPRPYSKTVFENFIKDASHRYKRLSIRPGITGPAQIMGRFEQLEGGSEEALKLDILYLENRNFFFDLKIIAHTIRAVIKFQGI